MRKIDKILALVLALVVGVLTFFLEIDYTEIASEGLTLASIVLAVYVAAMIGLINTDLAKKMASTLSAPKSEHTQLGQLTTYFRHAFSYAIATIVISSIALLVPAPDPKSKSQLIPIIHQVLSISGMTVYALNLIFLIFILRFMLNRQVWNS